MITYTDYEKQVYEWLMLKHEKDPNFTFSLRMKGSKGAELDYFIGTKKSNYFATTFWSIPVAYPGSSSDCIDLIFGFSNNLYSYNFEFTQTNSPDNTQNKSVLSFLKALHTSTISTLGFSYVSPESNRMFTLKTNQRQNQYTSLPTMLLDVEKDLEIIIPEVNKAITTEKLNNQEFNAHPITLQEFTNMQTKLEKRFEKYSNINKNVNYWIFQGNPEIYNITNALKAAHLKSWKVAAHKDKIAIGDKVILWLTGENSGCYALAEVISDVFVFEEEKYEKQYYVNPTNSTATDRVKIKITKYLADDPILWNDIKENPVFSEFKAGNLGTNFSATETEFMALLNPKNLSSNTKLNDLIQKYKSAVLNDNWLYVELYKFEWGNWLNKRVVFEEQTNEEILEVCLASQEENYTDAKGVQFIRQGAREKLSKYIGIEDIEIFRAFNSGVKLEDIDYSKRNMSYPILSCWMSVFVPNAIFPASRTSFADIIREVFSIELKSSKIDFVIAMQKPMQEICNVLLEDEEVASFVSKELHKAVLSPLDINWLTQDFLLFVDRHPNLLTQGTEIIEAKVELHMMIDTTPTNQILYGPPGTGKTYATISKAVAIANPRFNLEQERSIIKEEYKRLVDSNQIVFTTFHQSMSYEDFVEGIKPKTTEGKKITYEVEDGIFKQLADKAKGLKGKITSETNITDFKNKNYFKMSIGGKNRKDVHDWCINNNYISLGWGKEENYSEYNNIKNWDTYRNKFKHEFSYLVEDSKYHIQAMFIFQKMNIGDIVLISLGNHCIDAIGVITGEYEYIEDSDIPYRHFRKVKWLATNLDANPSLFVDKNISQQSIYQFNNDDIKVDYLIQTFSKSKEDIKTPKNHVLIIDEINRGNVSQIFGELITLIENDKRLGEDEALMVQLPYSKTKFGIPPNLFIIGTMNTADRSIEALDTALRRRFVFEETPPQPNLLKIAGKSGKVDGVVALKDGKTIDLEILLRTINNRIEKLIDKDHKIGHSYFLKVNSESSLKKVFKNNVIPLLEEYFFGDFGKIGLVLGDSFVDRKDEAFGFSQFKHYDDDIVEDLKSKAIFKINSHKLWNFNAI
ncbi:AAA family ATPase [Formosa sp. PL04]|uniref:AAA family ATPase n=1 Tax=Formosa sp. PL04 TaxID=3081755 RepID=UPI0029818F2B|nr:EVE domain-containing protein [Formosa sp. PL04]MDW5288877.1 AAA family ATPase [Formosa sp. PL04]